jgi:hypothetical protein
MQILRVFYLFLEYGEKISKNVNLYISLINRGKDLKIKDNIHQLIED